VQCDREAAKGDVKLYGYGVPVEDAARKTALADAQEAIIDWRPSEPFHVFALDVQRASYIAFGERRRLIRWSVDGGVEVMRHPETGAG
jgi:hypothetical protein